MNKKTKKTTGLLIFPLIITFFTFPQYHQDGCELQMAFPSLKPK